MSIIPKHRLKKYMDFSCRWGCPKRHPELVSGSISLRTEGPETKPVLPKVGDTRLKDRIRDDREFKLWTFWTTPFKCGIPIPPL